MVVHLSSQAALRPALNRQCLRCHRRCVMRRAALAVLLTFFVPILLLAQHHAAEGGSGSSGGYSGSSGSSSSNVSSSTSSSNSGSSHSSSTSSGSSGSVAAPAATQAVTEALTPRAESTTEHRTPRLALPVRLQRTAVRLPPAPEMLMPVHTRVWQVDPLGRTCARQVPIRERRVARTHLHCSGQVPS